MPLSTEQLSALRDLAEHMNRPVVFKSEDGDGYHECPMCDGEGSVTAELVSHAPSLGAAGVQVYGIGDDMTKLQEWVSDAPLLVLALLADAEAPDSADLLAMLADRMLECDRLRQQLTEARALLIKLRSHSSKVSADGDFYAAFNHRYLDEIDAFLTNHPQPAPVPAAVSDAVPFQLPLDDESRCPIYGLGGQDWHFDGQIGPVEKDPAALRIVVAWNTRATPPAPAADEAKAGRVSDDLIKRATAVMLAMNNGVDLDDEDSNVPYVDFVATEEHDDCLRGTIRINIADGCDFVTVEPIEGEPSHDVADAICSTGTVIRDLLAALGQVKP